MEISALYKIYEEHLVVTTDSRVCPKGSIFFALKGERFNGNLLPKVHLKEVVPTPLWMSGIKTDRKTRV